MGILLLEKGGISRVLLLFPSQKTIVGKASKASASLGTAVSQLEGNALVYFYKHI